MEIKMEIKIEIEITDLAVVSLQGVSLDLRFNPLDEEEHFWIPVRDRTAVKNAKIIKLA